MFLVIREHGLSLKKNETTFSEPKTYIREELQTHSSMHMKNKRNSIYVPCSCPSSAMAIRSKGPALLPWYWMNDDALSPSLSLSPNYPKIRSYSSAKNFKLLLHFICMHRRLDVEKKSFSHSIRFPNRMSFQGTVWTVVVSRSKS